MEIKAYPEEEVLVDGKSVKLASLSSDETNRLWADVIAPLSRGAWWERHSWETAKFAELIYKEYPTVYWINRRFWGDIVNLVRRVKSKTGTSYAGSRATGTELCALALRPNFFTKNGVTMTTWLFTATAGNDWFISGAGDAAITLSDRQGLIFLGFADPIDTPKVEAVQLEKGGIPYTRPITLDFAVLEDSPVISLPSAWVIGPEEKYRIAVRYYASGDDNLRPIGFLITTADEIANIW